MAYGLILIVDDDPLNVRLVSDVLELRGYEVVHARSGEAAIAITSDRVPAVVLMDIQLPGIDGIATREAMLLQPGMCDAKFIALTASVMPHEIASFEVVGFDAFHPKPVETQRLLQQIAAMMAGSVTNTASPPDTTP